MVPDSNPIISDAVAYCCYRFDFDPNLADLTTKIQGRPLSFSVEIENISMSCDRIVQ